MQSSVGRKGTGFHRGDRVVHTCLVEGCGDWEYTFWSKPRQFCDAHESPKSRREVSPGVWEETAGLRTSLVTAGVTTANFVEGETVRGGERPAGFHAERYARRDRAKVAHDWWAKGGAEAWKALLDSIGAPPEAYTEQPCIILDDEPERYDDLTYFVGWVVGDDRRANERLFAAYHKALDYGWSLLLSPDYMNGKRDGQYIVYSIPATSHDVSEARIETQSHVELAKDFVPNDAGGSSEGGILVDEGESIGDGTRVGVITVESADEGLARDEGIEGRRIESETVGVPMAATDEGPPRVTIDNVHQPPAMPRPTARKHPSVRLVPSLPVPDVSFDRDSLTGTYLQFYVRASVEVETQGWPLDDEFLYGKHRQAIPVGVPSRGRPPNVGALIAKLRAAMRRDPLGVAEAQLQAKDYLAAHPDLVPFGRFTKLEGALSSLIQVRGPRGPRQQEH